MARNVKELEAEIMGLPRKERARIIRDLIAGLERDAVAVSQKEWEAAWLEEVRRRDEEMEGSASESLPHEAMLASLRAIVNP